MAMYRTLTVTGPACSACGGRHWTFDVDADTDDEQPDERELIVQVRPKYPIQCVSCGRKLWPHGEAPDVAETPVEPPSAPLAPSSAQPGQAPGDEGAGQTRQERGRKGRAAAEPSPTSDELLLEQGDVAALSDVLGDAPRD